MGFLDLFFFYRQEYIFTVDKTVLEVKLLNRPNLYLYKPKQLSVMQDFCFVYNVDGIF